MMENQDFDIQDPTLAEEGCRKIFWARRFMPVLSAIDARFGAEKPLEGVGISACLHVTAETANLMLALKSAGCDIRLCASNPLTTNDAVAASLVKNSGIPVFARKGEDSETYQKHALAALSHNPMILMDDGADLTTAALKNDVGNIMGGTEETTSGVIRLRNMAGQKLLKFPVIAVNDAKTKHLFDNRYGTGQSTLDGIIRATNILIAGTTVVVCGYGWCGRGVAMRAQGLGANVIVTEIDPISALEAAMDGYRVMPMAEAAGLGDIFITVSANKNVIREEHFEKMQDGTILCNAGHFNIEIDIATLEKISVSRKNTMNMVEEYKLRNGKCIYLLAQGRLVNLACADGHPPSVMDMSFANQALSVEYIFLNHKKLENKVYSVPEEIDRNIARLKLEAMGIKIDTLTPEQELYINNWSEGT